MPKIPSRVLEIAEQLKANGQPRRSTVAGLLKMFGFERRRPNVVSEIRAALDFAGLTTDPNFADLNVGMDEKIRFLLDIPSDGSGTTPAQESSGLARSKAVPDQQQAIGGVSSADFSFDNGEIPNEDFLETEDQEDVPLDQPDDRPVSSQPNDWNIGTLRDKLDRGLLDLQPHYQREYVWSLRPELPSRLIESLLLEIPIPPIYFGKIPGGRLEVIDGQQRLTTLIEFVSNKFSLRKLNRMSSLNGKHFRDLSQEQQAKILDASIRSVVIDAGTNGDLRYEVFERLNRGSMALNEQEVRNCIFRGPFNDLLAGLEMDSAWRRVKGGNKPEPRFVERQMILRFFAFANRLNYYAGNLKGFLTEYMRCHAPTDPEQLRAQAAMFRQTMQNVYAVFGPQSARLYSVPPGSNDGTWDTKFSVAALDIQASALAGQPPAKVQAAAEQIRELFLFLILTKPDIQKAISKQTAGSTPTKLRWTAFKALVQPILDGTSLEPRFFDLQFRKQLFDASPICKLCGNRIHVLDDSTVDHVTPYSKGGKTVPDNGQLAHRSCNARKSATLPMQTTDAG
jgi:hypothetical protein